MAGARVHRTAYVNSAARSWRFIVKICGNTEATGPAIPEVWGVGTNGITFFHQRRCRLAWGR